jgi:hypothetical protein
VLNNELNKQELNQAGEGWRLGGEFNKPQIDKNYAANRPGRGLKRIGVGFSGESEDNFGGKTLCLG